MATTIGQSDTDAPLADCSVSFLLPRTLGSSFSAGAVTSETEEQDFVANLLKTTALKNFSQVLENAKMIGNSSFSSIPNVSSEEENAISAKRSREGQMELQTKRVRQRRPSLTGVEREGNIFNFSAIPAAVEVSEVGTSDLSRRANCAESNSVADTQSWPVIDYSCLENITDPMEYFSTYRMLENAEKEVKKLKGEAAPRPSQPQSRRDRQRRPGLSEFEGMKHVFKFRSNIATMEASQMENSSLSNDLNFSELNMASCSREISQTENSRTVEPESELDVNAKTCDSDVDEMDELERLLSQCRKLNNDELGIASFVRDSLGINPIYVKSKGLPSSIAAKNKFESHQLIPVSSVSRATRVDGLSTTKRRFSVIDRQGDPLFSPNHDGDKQSDDLEELGSSHKDFCDDRTKNFPCNMNVKGENLKSDFKDLRVDKISKSEKETLNAKLLDAEEMTNPVDHLSALKKPIPFIDIQSRLDKISILKRHMLRSTTEDENLLFQCNDLEDSSSSKSQEMHPFSPVDAIHLDPSSPGTQIACIPLFPNGKQPNSEDEVHSPVDEILEADKNNCQENASDSNGRQISLFEKETWKRSGGIISDRNLVPDTNFDEASSCDAVIEIGTDVPEQPLYSEIPKDQCLPNDPTLMDEQMEAPSIILNGKNKVADATPSAHKKARLTEYERKRLAKERTKNHGHSDASGGLGQRKLKKKEPTRRQIRQNSMLRRKSLEGAGTEWKTGVRRSTRIRMKPLQYWCGERFLYGRVHDSLATVIGVKKFDTPQKGRTAVMKVKSYVPEKYADLVALVALH